MYFTRATSRRQNMELMFEEGEPPNKPSECKNNTAKCVPTATIANNPQFKLITTSFIVCDYLDRVLPLLYPSRILEKVEIQKRRIHPTSCPHHHLHLHHHRHHHEVEIHYRHHQAVVTFPWLHMHLGIMYKPSPNKV